MRTDNKKGLRWLIFRWFGPPEVQNLINHIDNMTEDGSDIAIYRAGRFDFQVRSAEPGAPQEPFIFATEQERYCFGIGLNWGVQICGGEAHALNEEQFEQIEEMRKKSTHGGGNA